MRWYFPQMFTGGHNRAKNPALAKALVNVRGESEIFLTRSFTDGVTLGIPDGAETRQVDAINPRGA